MIETKILGAAVGIQRQDVIDKSETTVLPSLNNGVITGHFKRGRMDKSFKVTSANYRSLLGHDPSNPSYLAVEDAFKNGVSELSILRVGSPYGSDSGELPSEYPTPDISQKNNSVSINNSMGRNNNYESKFAVHVVEADSPNLMTHFYNQDKSKDISDMSIDSLSIYMDSSGYINISPSVNDKLLLVRLIPSEEQSQWSTAFRDGDGVRDTAGTFVFYLYSAS